jgi:hypothetical protein
MILPKFSVYFNSLNPVAACLAKHQSRPLKLISRQIIRILA